VTVNPSIEKIRHGITFGFSRGPSSNGNTHHDATTGGSRAMEAEPRMPPKKNPTRHEGRGASGELWGPGHSDTFTRQARNKL
jgi:hypothetical protein